MASCRLSAFKPLQHQQGPVPSSMLTESQPLLLSPLQMTLPAALQQCHWSQSWSWTRPSSSRWAQQVVLQHARLSLLLLVQATLCREQHLA